MTANETPMYRLFLSNQLDALVRQSEFSDEAEKASINRTKENRAVERINSLMVSSCWMPSTNKVVAKLAIRIVETILLSLHPAKNK